ncbi:MAG: hypothetical protein IPJ75_14835 [Ignavibacteriales bacterium]|nr:hypothetical protein [Ignavibacteriales bacterium]
MKLLIPVVFFLLSFTILPQKFTWTKLPVLTNKTLTVYTVLQLVTQVLE